ncbi:hypothetical protein F511_26884 [Dorcoceras hygrometricum]|uniref:Uncharacterized protein n=1 Tax=Dorcoceras hygrometricum TaxID=472368 RepID=A0A2Z7AZ21_9LAMI|nr:hypothetical protein F511_26884 [Dorcoceras hygrometricum]
MGIIAQISSSSFSFDLWLRRYMTSAYLLEEAINSKDDVSSKLQFFQQSTRSARAGSAMLKSAVTSAISRELQCNQQLQSQSSSRKMMYQLQATVHPVASYSALSRMLQCFAYPVAGNPDARKADVVKICKPVDKESNAKKQRK